MSYTTYRRGLMARPHFGARHSQIDKDKRFVEDVRRENSEYDERTAELDAGTAKAEEAEAEADALAYGDVLSEIDASRRIAKMPDKRRRVRGVAKAAAKKARADRTTRTRRTRKKKRPPQELP